VGSTRVGLGADRRIRIPRALGAAPASCVVCIESLPGRPLTSQLEAPGLEPLLRDLGRSLAGFHRSQVALTRWWTPADERRQIEEAVDAVAAAYPDLARRLGRLAAKLGRASNGRGPAGVLHGSLRLDHVLVHRGRFAFVDLDGARRGPPAYDIANLMASLYYLEAEGRVTRAARRRIVRSVLAGYASVAAEDVPAATLLGFVADLLVAKQALKYATRLRADRRRRLERMLDLAEEISSLASKPTAVAAAWKGMP
jgi:Ser/Thr protein kinase RdoA (MazF antagonist)